MLYSYRTLKTCELAELDMDDARLAAIRGVSADDVITWIRDELPVLLSNLRDTVQPQLPGVTGQGLSLAECRCSLLEAHADFDLAVSLCVAKRQAVVERLSQQEPSASQRQVVQVRHHVFRSSRYVNTCSANHRSSRYVTTCCTSSSLALAGGLSRTSP